MEAAAPDHIVDGLVPRLGAVGGKTGTYMYM